MRYFFAFIVATISIQIPWPTYAQLPPEVQADILKEEIAESLKAEDYPSTKKKIAAYRKLGVGVPPAVDMIDAKVAVALKEWSRARSILEEYFKKNGKSDASYTEALQIYKGLDKWEEEHNEFLRLKEKNRIAARLESKRIEIDAKFNRYNEGCYNTPISAEDCYEAGKIAVRPWSLFDEKPDQSGKYPTYRKNDWRLAEALFERGCYSVKEMNRSCIRLALTRTGVRNNEYLLPTGFGVKSDPLTILKWGCEQLKSVKDDEYIRSCIKLGHLYLQKYRGHYLDPMPARDISAALFAFDAACTAGEWNSCRELEDFWLQGGYGLRAIPSESERYRRLKCKHDVAIRAYPNCKK